MAKIKIYDSHIRPLLFSELAKQNEFILASQTFVVQEMDVCCGCARIDISLINGLIHGFELKSEKDNLARLPSQTYYYNMVFDKINIVVTESHHENAMQIIPNWWGVYLVSKANHTLNLIQKRHASINPEINLHLLTQILWRQELVELLQANGIYKGIKSKNRFELGKIACQHLEGDHIKSFVRHRLKNRKSWKAVRLQQLCDDLQILLPS